MTRQAEGGIWFDDETAGTRAVRGSRSRSAAEIPLAGAAADRLARPATAGHRSSGGSPGLQAGEGSGAPARREAGENVGPGG
jgi:hypothetical protein